MEEGTAGMIFGLALGLILALLLALLLAPDRKAECDAFGATRFGNQVYVCHPK